MFFLALLVLTSASVFSYRIRPVVIFSENTPSALVSHLASLSNTSYEIPVLQFSNSILPALVSSSKNLIFDLTDSLTYRKALQDFAANNEILYFSAEDSTELYSRWVFRLHPPPHIEARALQLLVKYLNWSDYNLVSSHTSRSRAIHSSMTSSPPNVLSSQVDQKAFDLFSSRSIKPSGNWKTLYIGEEPGASQLLEGLENSRIYKERGGLVVSSKCSWGTFKLGTIALVEEGLEQATSQEDYEVKAILRAINILEVLIRDLKGSAVSNEIIANRIEEMYPDHTISDRYSVLNFKEDLKIIGTIQGERIDIFEDFVFPGNMTMVDNSLPKILLSANTGPLEFNGTYNYLTFIMNLGLQPMVHLVNNDPNILPNYQLELHETDCGFLYFSYNHALACMQRHFDKLGVTHLGTSEGETLDGYLKLFAERNIRIPNVVIGSPNETVYDKTIFPEVLVTTPKTFFYYTILPYIIKSFRWDQIILLFNSHIDPYYYSAFVDNAKILKIDILNLNVNMFVPYFKTEKYYDEVKDLIQFIYDSRCKIIVLLADPHSHLFFMEALYDFGFRKGDLVLIFQNLLSEVIDYPEQYNFEREKVMELGDGSLSIYYAEYVGEYGEQLRQQIAPMIYPYPTFYTCFKIDSLMLAVHTIDLMLNLGRDFEDFTDIMHFMRGIRFTGCTGKVSIDSGGNGRSDVVYSISNFYITGDQWKEDIAGSYTLGITVPLKISKTIIWPNGMTVVPKDIEEDPICGFPDKMIKSNQTSLIVSVIITVAIFVIVSVVAMIVWWFFFNYKKELLEEKRDMYFEDGILVYMPLLEAAQLVGLGPSFEKENFYLSYVVSALCLELDELIDFEFGDFWIVMNVAIGVLLLWGFSLFFTFSKFEERFPRMIRDFFHVLGFKLIYVISQCAFVSINVLMFKIYKCNDGIGEDLTDSFLYNDCKTSCWEYTHLFYAIAISIVLVFYNLCAIVARPISDELMDYVSVKTQPFYAYAKGIFQLLLVILNLHLKSEYKEIYSVVYCCALFVWMVFLFRIEAYNYERLNGWVRVFGLGVFMHELLMVIYTVFEISGLAVVIFQVLIAVLCTGAGFYVQFKWFPSMLHRRKGRNFDKLLKFAFSKRVKAWELTLHELDYIDR